ncbi:MAG TPA: PAS domain S-box protein [Chitinophagaceae bacterium]|nr:PAS domain S-box protein [Chitinophagaceae bacterium]
MDNFRDELEIIQEISVGFGIACWAYSLSEKQFLYISPALKKLYGVPMDEEIEDPEHWLRFIHPEDLHHVRDQLKGLKRKREVTLQYRIMKDVGTRMVEERRRLVPGPGNISQRMEGLLTDITYRKKTETELKKALSGYRLLFDNNPNPMWVYDLESLRFLAVNNAAIYIYGYTRKEFLSLTLKDIRTPDQHLRLDRRISDIRDMAQWASSQHWKHIRKDGTLIDVDIHSHEIQFQGRSARLVQIIDITDKVKAENELNIYQQNLQALIDNTSDLIWSLDFGFKLVTFNQAYSNWLFQVFGVLPMKGQSILVPEADPELVSRWKNFYEKAMAGNAYRVEESFLHQGSTEFMEIYFNPIRENTGKVIGIGCFARDITAIREAIGKIKQNIEELDSIFESITDGFVAVSKDWIFARMNKECEKLLHRKREDLIGKCIWDVFPDEDRYQFRAVFERAANKRETVHFEEFFAPFNQWFSGSVYPSTEGISIYFRDITGSKIARQQILDQNDQLREIAWISSHGIRKPVANILGLIDLFQDDERDKKNGEIINMLRLSAKELDQVVHRIVDKSRVVEKSGDNPKK